MTEAKDMPEEIWVAGTATCSGMWSTTRGGIDKNYEPMGPFAPKRLVGYEEIDRAIDTFLGKEDVFELDRGNIQYFANKILAPAPSSDITDELLGACQSAYFQMLQMPYEDLRFKSQKVLSGLRDAIANAENLDPAYVQNFYEEAAAIAKATKKEGRL